MKLSSATFLNAMEASFEQLAISAGSEQTQTSAATTLSRLTLTASAFRQISLQAEVGEFLIFARYLDTFFVDDGSGAGERAVFEFFKTLTDDFAAADLATKTFVKTLTDTGLVAEEVIRDIIKAASDKTVFDEHFTFGLDKPLVEQVFHAEDKALLFTKKIASDAAAFADEETLAVGKGLNDLTASLDEFAMSFARPLADASVTLDHTQLHPNKGLFSTVTGIEDETRTFTKKVKADVAGVGEAHFFDLGRLVVDASAMSDDELRAFGKRLTDTSILADERKLDVEKFLTSNVFASDDVDGLASILDDQEMQFFKNTNHVVGSTDTLEIRTAYLRNFTDAYAALDFLSVAFGKPLAHVALTADSVYFAIEKNIEDTGAVSEAHKFDVSRLITDAASIGDLHSLRPAKGFYDASSATDSYFGTLGKVVNETTSFSDNAAKAFGSGYTDDTAFSEAHRVALSKQLYSAVNATDDFDGTASLLDDQEMQFVKAVTDAAGVGDFIEVLLFVNRNAQDILNIGEHRFVDLYRPIGDSGYVRESISKTTLRQRVNVLTFSDSLNASMTKVKNDTASSTDTGSLRSQGYSDFTYFSEDYVGASRTF